MRRKVVENVLGELAPRVAEAVLVGPPTAFRAPLGQLPSGVAQVATPVVAPLDAAQPLLRLLGDVAPRDAMEGRGHLTIHADDARRKQHRLIDVEEFQVLVDVALLDVAAVVVFDPRSGRQTVLVARSPAGVEVDHLPHSHRLVVGVGAQIVPGVEGKARAVLWRFFLEAEEIEVIVELGGFRFEGFDVLRVVDEQVLEIGTGATTELAVDVEAGCVETVLIVEEVAERDPKGQIDEPTFEIFGRGAVGVEKPNQDVCSLEFDELTLR